MKYDHIFSPAIHMESAIDPLSVQLTFSCTRVLSSIKHHSNIKVA